VLPQDTKVPNGVATSVSRVNSTGAFTFEESCTHGSVPTKRLLFSLLPTGSLSVVYTGMLG